MIEVEYKTLKQWLEDADRLCGCTILISVPLF